MNAASETGPRPRDRIGKVGTKAAGALAQQVRIRAIEVALPPTSIPELKLTRAHLTREEVESLEHVLAGQAEDRDIRTARSSPKRSLERLINAREYQALTIPNRASILRAVAASNGDVETILAAVKLVESRALEGLPPGDRDRALDLFHLLAPRERANLSALALRNLHGRSALLDRDFEDTFAIAHLLALAGADRCAAPIANLGLLPDGCMAKILACLAHPERMPAHEGADGVLGAVEFALADSSPAELARIGRCLLLGDMVAELPGVGALDLGEALRSGREPDRTEIPVRAGLELLAGLAHPRGGPKRASFVMPGARAIDADVLARALGYLYGVGLTVVSEPKAVERHLERATSDVQRVPPVFVSQLHENGERLFLFERMTKDAVLVRSPHGGSSKPKGARRADPLRHVEDPFRGVDSIPRIPFLESVGFVLAPRT